MASWREIESIRKRPHEFRAWAEAMLSAGDGDLTEWEADFLEGILAKPDQKDGYSLRQSEKLLEIRDGRISVDAVRGFSVVTLVRKCFEARFDLSEDDEAWIVGLHEANASAVKRRDAGRLLRCAEHIQIIDPVSA